MDAIGPLQLRIMHIIWNRGPSTVHEVHSLLNEEPGAQQLAYTTILTVMRNLSRRNVLKQTPAGRSHVFEPLIDEVTYKLGILQQIRDDLFAGSLSMMLETLAKDEALESKEQQVLQEITDRIVKYL